MLARRSKILVNYQGIDITDEVSKDLLSFSYTDNASGQADSISLSLKDDHKKWMKNWFPEKGDTLTPIIETLNWRRDGDKQRLPCGLFFVDQPEYSGRPSVLTIGAVSSPLNSNFKDVDRSRVWVNITLKEIANDISKRAGLTLHFIGNTNPRYQNIEQTETPDSAFISELCENEGLAMKVTDSKVIIFDEVEFEKKKSVTTIKEWKASTISYSFRSSLSNTAYAGVNVKYYDSKLGKTIEFLYTIRDIDPDKDKIYQLNQKVNSGEEAKRLAQKTLRKLNKKEYIGTLTIVGNLSLVGSSCVECECFGKFDGKYYIQSATHDVGNGFTTTIEVRKVLEGY